MSVSLQFQTWASLAMCIALAGCTKGKIEEFTQSFTENKAVKSVVETVPIKTGSIEFGLQPPVKIGSGFGRFAAFTDGRPSLLSITSYREASQETFPAALIHAQTDVQSIGELAGKTVTAEIFVATDASTTWHTPTGELAQIKISAVNGEEVTGDIIGGTIVKAGGGTPTKLTGKFKGLLK